MFIPTTKEECQKLGWNQLDVILVSGDTYIDTPYSGIAIVGKILISEGYKVGIICQPDIKSADDITRLGEPKLYWGVGAGIKDVSFIVSGINSYGYLKTENGIHRLVRISPFDSNSKRHTSFASVMVSPEVDDNIDIEIEDKDIRIDTYRASGAGGQHVNKTESAIRITHIETNVVVQCQNDRSQHKNKASAMKMLKSRLYELELEKQAAEKQGISKSEIGWGHQIRSYVMQPYQQVKDTRSNIGYSNIDGILDGDLDKMIEDVLISQSK